jgi:hypothetical protein
MNVHLVRTWIDRDRDAPLGRVHACSVEPQLYALDALELGCIDRELHELRLERGNALTRVALAWVAR